MMTNRIFKMALALFLGLVTSTIILSCGGGGGGGTPAAGDGGGGGGVGIVQTVQFDTVSYLDDPGIGIEAFSILKPSEWNFAGGIEWQFDNPGSPAVGSFSISDPNGKAELQLLPPQSFFSTQHPLILLTFPVGSKYFGNEVRPWPPLGPLDTLKEIIIPRFRGGVVNLQVIAEDSLPEITVLLRAGLPPQTDTTTEAAKIRIEYEQNGVPMEEEIYCVIEKATFQIEGFDSSLWIADFLFSFKAQKGSLDAQYQVFQTMMYSFRLNPQWFNKYVQLIDALVQQQIQIIQGYGQISQIISQTSNDISDRVWQSYNNRNAAGDRMAENFSNYILGTDTYYNPIEQATVKLPSGYSDAWANALGEYILSDNVNYNPNVDLGQNWQRMEIR